MFKYLALTLPFIAAFAASTGSASAAATRIDCPVNQVRTEITTNLPSGWWQTPQVGSLQSTKVGEVGGDKTLMCGYWAYGKEVFIMRKAPAGANCSADAAGFSCTTGGLVSATYRTGPITLKQTWVMDLDKGTAGGMPGGDVWFQAKTATQRFMTPVNGASMAIAGNTSINLAGCRSLGGYSTNSRPINQFPVGTYVCVKTNEGRFSQFRINAGPGASPGVLEIGFTTWK